MDTHMEKQIMPPSAIDQFRDAMAKHGITPPSAVVTDGKIHRFSSSGKNHDDAGWYVFYDGAVPAGAFGDWRSGEDNHSWVADVGRRLSPSEKQNLRRQNEERARVRTTERIVSQEKAKKKAAGVLHYSAPAADTHPYLLKKNVKSHRLRMWKGLLAIPMQDENGKLQNIQLIDREGAKRFLAGGKVQGCFFPLGTVKSDGVILIAEGYATAATLHEITGHPAMVAFNSGNLSSVAEAIRKKYPNALIVLCADDDHTLKDNPGLTKAAKAAHAVAATLIVPEFGPDRPLKATDFNDMAAHNGKGAITRLFQKHTEHTILQKSMAGLTTNSTEDEQDAVIARPTNKKIAASHVEDHQGEPVYASQNARPLEPQLPLQPLREKQAAKTETHFAQDEFEAIQKIWNSVPHRTAYHNKNGYHLVVDETRKVLVSRDRIEFACKPRHRTDETYAAACEHARQFWGGVMEVRGDNQHRIKAWAYASVYGVKVTNFTPSAQEKLEAEKIMASLGKVTEPTFTRPLARPQESNRPQPRPGM